MKPVAHFQPPRSAVIYRHTRAMLDQTALCMRKFAMRVAEQYMAALAPDLRQVPFRWGVTGDDLFKAEKHNAQQISRYMDGTVKSLPVDLEDAWLLALPEPYRSECERDLARRRGLVTCRLAESPGQAVTDVGTMMVEVGHLYEALGPALADGRISPRDLPHARRILDESDDVIGAVLCVRSQIAALVDGAPVAVRTSE